MSSTDADFVFSQNIFYLFFFILRHYEELLLILFIVLKYDFKQIFIYIIHLIPMPVFKIHCTLYSNSVAILRTTVNIIAAVRLGFRMCKFHKRRYDDRSGILSFIVVSVFLCLPCS